MDLQKLTYEKKDGTEELRGFSTSVVVPEVQVIQGRREIRPLPDAYTKGEPTLDADIIFIIAGGEKRERDYFHLIEYDRKVRRVKIAFLSKEHQGLLPHQMRMKAMSALENKTLNTSTHSYTIEDEDTIFLLSDVDEFSALLLKELEGTKNTPQIKWIVSNPAFEIWLYYHYFANPFPNLADGVNMPVSERSKWLKARLAELQKGGVNPIKAFEQIQTAIKNSIDCYFETEGLPGLYATQMHQLARKIVDAMGSELDELIRRRSELAAKFRRDNRIVHDSAEAVPEEKKHWFIDKLIDCSEEYKLRLPVMESHFSSVLTRKDTKVFPRSLKIEKSVFNPDTPIQESNLAEVFLNDIRQEIEHSYNIQFLLRTPVKTVAIDYSEIKNAFDILSLNNKHFVLSGVQLETFDSLYPGTKPFIKRSNGYEYNGTVIERLNIHERCLYVMRKEIVPRISSKAYEGGDFRLAVPDQLIYSNIDNMQKMPDGYGLSVMRVIDFFLPHDVNFKFIKLNIVDCRKGQSELEKLSKCDMIGLQYEEGDLVKIKTEFRKKYILVFKNDTSFAISNICGNGMLQLVMIEGAVPYEHIEPIPINGKDDIDIYYDPFIAASIIGPNDSIPVHQTDYSYYLEHFKRIFFEGEDGTLYDRCMNQEFRYVHEVQHWLRDMYGWDRLFAKHRR